jgi:hypothetical protein
MKRQPKNLGKATENFKVRNLANERQAALGAFLDEWEKRHGAFTPAELQRAEQELRVRS